MAIKHIIKLLCTWHIYKKHRTICYHDKCIYIHTYTFNHTTDTIPLATHISNKKKTPISANHAPPPNPSSHVYNPPGNHTLEPIGLEEDKLWSPGGWFSPICGRRKSLKSMYIYIYIYVKIYCIDIYIHI